MFYCVANARMEKDLVKMHHEKMESTAKIKDLERQLHQSLKREESNKRQLEESKLLKFENVHWDLSPNLLAKNHPYHINQALKNGIYSIEHGRHHLLKHLAPLCLVLSFIPCCYNIQ